MLDTHVLLWWQEDDPGLGADVREAIAGAPEVFVSAASAWEASIKASLGRLRIPESFGRGVDAAGFTELPVTFSHAERVAELPHHHGDPFDRLLVAQAQLEGLSLVSRDRRLALYEVDLLPT